VEIRCADTAALDLDLNIGFPPLLRLVLLPFHVADALFVVPDPAFEMRIIAEHCREEKLSLVAKEQKGRDVGKPEVEIVLSGKGWEQDCFS
jgi:hypothetical protein